MRRFRSADERRDQGSAQKAQQARQRERNSQAMQSNEGRDGAGLWHPIRSSASDQGTNRAETAKSAEESPQQCQCRNQNDEGTDHSRTAAVEDVGQGTR